MAKKDYGFLKKIKMDYGFAAITLNTFALVPQFIKTLRSNSVGDMSFAWLLLSFVSNMLWVAYAHYQNGGTQVLVMGIVFSIFYGTLTFVKIRTDMKKEFRWI